MATVGLRKGYVARLDNSGGSLQAPVCHVAPTAEIPLPSGPTLPSIPVPNNAPPSVAALINGYNQLSGNGPSGGGGTGGGLSGFSTDKSKQKDVGRFIEQSRQTQKVRVTNPDDDSIYVDVMVITALTMKDTKTGETWVWTR